jgi:hypothetical protein
LYSNQPEDVTVQERMQGFSTGKQWSETSFDLLLKIDHTEKLSSANGRVDIVNEVEMQARRAAAALGETMMAAAGRLREKIGPGFGEETLFQWLPASNRQIVMQDNLAKGFLVNRFNLGNPLAGQRADEINTVICTVCVQGTRHPDHRQASRAAEGLEIAIW